MIAMITTTMIIPLHNPTLKIPSTASQELNEIVMNARTVNNRLFFILIRFIRGYAKTLPPTRDEDQLLI